MRRLAMNSSLATALLMSGATGALAQTESEEREVYQPSQTQMRVLGGDQRQAIGMTGEAMPMEGRLLIRRTGETGWHGMMGSPDRPVVMRLRPGTDALGMMDGAAFLYGVPQEAQQEMTPERVRAFLEVRLEWHGNPRLTIGEIATEEDGNITAEIVTVDGSLVQKLAFNRYPGLFRQVTE